VSGLAALSDLTEGEYRLLREVLDVASLWPFAIVAATLGLDGAVEACRSRTLPEDLLVRLATVGYGVMHLPQHKSVVDLRDGVRMEAAWRRKRGDRSLAAVARDLGLDPREARRAWHRLRAFGWLPGSVMRSGGWL
jgi:hypothetical protein